MSISVSVIRYIFLVDKRTVYEFAGVQLPPLSISSVMWFRHRGSLLEVGKTTLLEISH